MRSTSQAHDNAPSTPRVAVLGSANVDYVTFVDRMPEGGETILATDALVAAGGKGANQAIALARMGAHVAMFGAVGDDSNGDLALRHLEAAGVDVSDVERVAEHTGFATVTVDAGGENRIVVATGANSWVTPEYVDRRLDRLATFDAVVMQLEIPLESVAHAARELQRRGTRVILDPAPAPDVLPAGLLRSVDIVKPNASELRRLTGESDVVAGAAALIATGTRCVVASLGADGAIVAVPGHPVVRIDAEPVEAIDTTGAGDSLTAAMAFAVAAGRSVEDAVRFGVEVATAVVQHRGAQAAVPSADQLTRMWAREAAPASTTHEQNTIKENIS